MATLGRTSTAGSARSMRSDSMRFAELRASNRHLLRGDGARIVDAATPLDDLVEEGQQTSRSQRRRKATGPPPVNPALMKMFPGLRPNSGMQDVKLVLQPKDEVEADAGAGGGRSGTASPSVVARSSSRGGVGSRGARSRAGTAGAAIPEHPARRRLGTTGSTRRRPQSVREAGGDFQEFNLTSGTVSNLWDPELTRSSMDQINSLQMFRRSIRRHKPVFGAGTTSMSKIVGEVRKKKGGDTSTDLAASARKLMERPAFKPSSVAEAKATIESSKHDFTNAFSEFDSWNLKERRDEHERRRKFLAGEFKQNNPSSAKTGVAVRYYMNSPDEEALEMERMLVREKTLANKAMMDRKLKRIADKRRERFALTGPPPPLA